ncbi:12148_t:CDS:2 [Funneliformis geosporum]|uniref:12148_t:CDS:1 n=1 Tax=Funneliformis geosporum TaxID=1117311 RepID=A0A9W4WZM3_9GLOM|nr:12148_t:CDS:2 [Funneliformis geosporum]
MKDIDKVMKGRFLYKDTELKWVLQQLHHHHRENWKVSLDPEKGKSEKKRKIINSRRSDKKE